MNKNLIISIVLMLVLSFSAFADTVALNETTNDFGTVNKGTTLTDTFLVTNTGANNISTLYFAVNNSKFTGATGTENITTSVTTFTPASIANFANGANQSVSYSIALPSLLFADTYTGRILALNSTNAELATLDVNFTVAQNASLVVPSISVSGIAGETKTANLTINNTGNTNVALIAGAVTLSTLTNTATPTDTISATVVTGVPSNAMTINYKAASTSALSIAIPAGKSGTYTGTFTVNYGGQTATGTLTLTVSAATSTSSITASNVEWVSGINAANLPIAFTVANTGNQVLTNEVCTVSGFYSGSTEAIPQSSIVPHEFTIASLAVGATSSQQALLTALPSSLAMGTYTATISCTHASNATVSLTYRNATNALTLPSSITLGSSTQSRNATVTQTFTIKNSGDAALTNVKLSLSNANVRFTENNGSTYNITSLAKNEEKTISLQIAIPYSISSGRVSMGTLSAIADELTRSVTSSVYVETKPMLSIIESDTYIKIDDGSKKDMNVDGSISNFDVKPGSKVTVYVKFESLFDPDLDAEEDIEINDITLTATADDIDVEESSEGVSLKPEKKGTATFTFNVPVDVSDDTVTVDFELTGTDDEDAEHTIQWSVDLDVDRDSRRLKFVADDTKFASAEVYCDETVYLNARVLNIGEKEIDNAVLEVTNTDLNYKYTKTADLTTDYGDDDNGIELNNFAIDLKSYNAKAKTYTFTLKATGNSASSDTVTLNLRCVDRTSSTGSTGTTGSNNLINIVTSNKTDTASTNTAGTAQTASSSSANSAWGQFRNSPSYVIMLIIVILFVILIFLWAASRL